MSRGLVAMSLIRINTSPQGPVTHNGGAPAGPALRRALGPRAAQGAAGPIIVMVHGYRFLPGDPQHCPHRHILSDHRSHACRKAVSWPRGLGIGEDGRLGLAFGWPARGTIWQAYARAEAAGRDLAQVLAELRRLAPHRPIHALGHSLGARVLLSALAALDSPVLDRVLLLAAADHASHLEAALTSPAGRRARLLHVTSGENGVFDLMLGGLVLGRRWNDAVLGRAGVPALPELRLDDSRHLAGLCALGFPLAAPDRRICHWSTYLREGAFPLYRALTGPQGAALHAEVTQAIGKPAQPARAGWSLPLPWGANASS